MDVEIKVIEVHMVVVVVVLVEVLSVDAAHSVAMVREPTVPRKQMLKEVDVAPGDSRELR